MRIIIKRVIETIKSITLLIHRIKNANPNKTKISSKLENLDNNKLNRNFEDQIMMKFK